MSFSVGRTPPHPAVRRRFRTVTTVGLSVLMSGCATLPSSGPTVSQVVDSERREAQRLGFTVVDIDGAVIDRLASGAAGPAGQFAGIAAPGEVDMIGIGDELVISIFELGAALFSTPRELMPGLSASGSTGSSLPPVVVGRDGRIDLPYIGSVDAAGLTAPQLQRVIEQRLRGQSQNAQVLVAVRDNLTNTVILLGDVKKPGRQRLNLARPRLLDAIAEAGGPQFPTADTVVRLARRSGATAEMRMSDIAVGSGDDVPLLPGDRIEIIRRPRTFTALGAAPKVAEVPFDVPNLTLIQAVARAGGPAEAYADPTGVFLFRYEQRQVGAPPVPVIYRLNMMLPSSYFLAQRFPMRDKDVVYIANARSNQALKFVQVLGLLFSPILTAKIALDNN